jgi:hypothetical protein
MKKLNEFIKLLFLIASLTGCNPSIAQVNANFGIGADTHKHIVYNVGFGYDIGRFQFTGEIRPSFTRDADTHNYLGFKGGIGLFNEADAYLLSKQVYAEFGYYYDKVNSEKVELNKWHYAAGIKGVKMITEQGGITGELFYINNSIQLTAGMLIKFN